MIETHLELQFHARIHGWIDVNEIHTFVVDSLIRCIKIQVNQFECPVQFSTRCFGKEPEEISIRPP